MNLMNEMMSDLESDMSAQFTEEKHASKDYVKMMVKADTEERKAQTVQQNDLTINEIKHLELYLAQLHTECDFLLRNFDNRHDARVDEEHGLESAESIVTKEEVQTHNQMEKVYEQEHSEKQVHEHFPEMEMPVDEPEK